MYLCKLQVTCQHVLSIYLHGLIQLSYMLQGGGGPSDRTAVLRGDMPEEAGVTEHVAGNRQCGRVYTLPSARQQHGHRQESRWTQ